MLQRAHFTFTIIFRAPNSLLDIKLCERLRVYIYGAISSAIATNLPLTVGRLSRIAISLSILSKCSFLKYRISKCMRSDDLTFSRNSSSHLTFVFFFYSQFFTLNSDNRADEEFFQTTRGFNKISRPRYNLAALERTGGGGGGGSIFSRRRALTQRNRGVTRLLL